MHARLLTGSAVVLLVALAGGCAKREEKKSAPAAAVRGPEIVRDMIAAHGGMQAWHATPTVSFEDEFVVPGQPAQVSRVTVEQSSRRAYMDLPATSGHMSWDGAKAWSQDWKSPMPPRFLALLNYYFADLPWLTQDPGVKLGAPGTGKLAGDPTEYVTVMMTFEPGTGDTPDDYYRLYIDPTTKRLKACAYVVTYRSLLPPGVHASPENLLVYDEMTTVNGLVVPVRYTIYENGAVYATCSIRNWSFDQPFDAGRMTMPAGAVVDTTTP